MVWIYALIGLLLGIVAFVGSWPFLPVIQVFTNSSNEGLNQALNATGFSNTPFASIMHLWPVWTMLLIGICIVFIVVMVARRGS